MRRRCFKNEGFWNSYSVSEDVHHRPDRDGSGKGLGCSFSYANGVSAANGAQSALSSEFIGQTIGLSYVEPPGHSAAGSLGSRTRFFIARTNRSNPRVCRVDDSVQIAEAILRYQTISTHMAAFNASWGVLKSVPRP